MEYAQQTPIRLFMQQQPPYSQAYQQQPPVYAQPQQIQYAPQPALHHLQVPVTPAAAPRPYVSAAQAGLSPSPFSPAQLRYPEVHSNYAPSTYTPNGSPAPPAQYSQQPWTSSGGYEAPSSLLAPELGGDELAWLRYVRNHELLPYDGAASNSAGTSAPGAAAEAAGAAALGKSVGYALLLNRVTGVRIPPHVEAKASS